MTARVDRPIGESDRRGENDRHPDAGKSGRDDAIEWLVAVVGFAELAIAVATVHSSWVPPKKVTGGMSARDSALSALAADCRTE